MAEINDRRFASLVKSSKELVEMSSDETEHVDGGTGGLVVCLCDGSVRLTASPKLMLASATGQHL